MKTRPIGRLALTAAIAAMGAAAGTTSVPSAPTAPQALEAPALQQAPTQQSGPTQAQEISFRQLLKLAGHPAMAVNWHKAIWVASAKRGNRRGRSRWNYNR